MIVDKIMDIVQELYEENYEQHLEDEIKYEFSQAMKKVRSRIENIDEEVWTARDAFKGTDKWNFKELKRLNPSYYGVRESFPEEVKVYKIGLSPIKAGDVVMLNYNDAVEYLKGSKEEKTPFYWRDLEIFEKIVPIDELIDPLDLEYWEYMPKDVKKACTDVGFKWDDEKNQCDFSSLDKD